MKQRTTKYRYFYQKVDNYLIRFNKEGKGIWYNEKQGRFPYNWISVYTLSSALESTIFTEVTLYQGLHYLKGNYVE